MDGGVCWKGDPKGSAECEQEWIIIKGIYLTFSLLLINERSDIVGFALNG